jgi:hypothetical protein
MSTEEHPPLPEIGFIGSYGYEKSDLIAYGKACAEHAAAAEREACAKLVEKMCSGKWVTVDKMAEAIRARTA